MDAKALSKIADICRKKGIQSLKMSADSVEFTLTDDLPRKLSRKEQDAKPVVEEPQYTPEQILMWSAAGMPDEVING